MFLFGDQVIYLVMQIFQDDLGFEIHLIIVLGSLPVFVFLAVLAHQNDRGLYGGQAGEYQIQQDKRIGIEGQKEIMNTQLPATLAILSATRSP